MLQQGENKGIEGRRESEGITDGRMQNRQGFMMCIYNLEFTIAITAASAFDNTSSTWRPIPGHPHLLTHRFKLTSTVYVSICAQPILSITFDIESLPQCLEFLSTILLSDKILHTIIIP